MIKRFILLGILFVMVFIACDKNDDDISAKFENDWFAIPNRPGELGELLYYIYTNSGVSVFVNDTLGSTYKGEDAYGNPAYDYETISEKFYIYGNREKIRFVLSHDTSAMILAAKTIKNWVIPNLPEQLSEQRIKSILLTDTLLWSVYGGDTLKRKDAKSAWVSPISVETLPVGRLFDIKQMDKQTLKFWAGMILSERPMDWIMKNCVDEMQAWVDTTEVDRTMKSTFFGNGYSLINWEYDKETGEPVDGPGSKYYQDSFGNFKKGFLEWADTPWEEPASWSEDYMTVHYKAAMMNLDMMNYIAAIYANSDEEFATMFSGVEGEKKILAKRKIMKLCLEKWETKFGVTRHPFVPFE